MPHTNCRFFLLTSEGGWWLTAADMVRYTPTHAPDERFLIVARRAADGLETLPVHHAGLPDGIQMRDLMTGVEATVASRMLPLDSLPNVGAQVWRVVRG